MTVFSDFAKMDLSILPDEVLISISKKLNAEIKRRDGIRNSDKEALREVRRRVQNTSTDGRRQMDLLIPEWDLIFANGDTQRKYYVYAHVRPFEGYMEIQTEKDQFNGVRIPGVPFYVGKGTGARAFDLSRNGGHGAEIRSLNKNGVQSNDIAHIIASDLTEDEALRLESKLIYILGTRYELGACGLLVNLDIPKKPESLSGAIKALPISRMVMQPRRRRQAELRDARKS